MSEMTYSNLLSVAMNLYVKGDFLEAYHYITENGLKVKGCDAHIYNFRYCFACKAGLNDLAIEIMKEAIIEKGYWYSYAYLLEEEDIKPLNEYTEFRELASICKDREVEANRDSKSYIKIMGPENIVENEKYPLLIALHGNGQNALIAENNWSSCVTDDYILALLQSSQVGFSNAYFWNDYMKGSKDLKEQYVKVLREKNVDLDNIVIGGFSAGTRVALYAMLNDEVKVKGFIFIGPWLPEINEWECLIDKLKQNDIKGYIICGDKDIECIECTRRFVDMLNQRDIPNIYKEIKDLKHEFPNDFESYLKEALEFFSL